MAWLRFHVRFGMERRARPRLTRLHLLPAVRTDCLLLAAISMLQQQLPWHLTNKLRPSQRRLACHLIKCRLRTLFPPRPPLVKHLFGRARMLCLRLIPFHCGPPLLFSFPTPRLPPFILTKHWDAPRLGLQDRSTARCTVAEVTASGVYLLCGTSPIRKLESATSSHRVASEPSKGMSNELRTNSPACHCAVG